MFGIITAVAAAPAIVGASEAIRHGQRENAREEQRGRKTHLVVTLLDRSPFSQVFDGAYVVLKDNKLWVDTTGVATKRLELHSFTGYFLPFRDMATVWRSRGFRRGEGMVTTISDDPPFLNWVYLDKDTHEVKYGTRQEAEPNLVGPWDVTKSDRRLTFEGWEGFAAVEEEKDSGLWALYFDKDDDGLRGEGRVGTKGLRAFALEVWRRELRIDRDTADGERLERLRARDEQSSEETTVS